MKTFIGCWLMLLFCFNNAASQNRSYSMQIEKKQTVDARRQERISEPVDTGKVFLVFSKDSKPLISLNADFSKPSGWFDLIVNDTAGNRKFQSLLHVVNENLIQWKVFDGTSKGHPSESKGEIIIRRNQ